MGTRLIDWADSESYKRKGLGSALLTVAAEAPPRHPPPSLPPGRRGHSRASTRAVRFGGKPPPACSARMGPQLGKTGVAPLTLLGLCFAVSVRSLPLADAGPHVNYGWGEPIRFRHLYTASRHGLFSYFLRIHGDGRVDGAGSQSRQSLLEIRAVSLRTVAMKGVHSSRYLCMEEEGRLHGLLRYSTEDCSFEEEIRPDGYNIYKSKKYGILVSLSNARQRQQYKGKDFLPLSHFLPMMNSVPVEIADSGDYSDARQYLESAIFNQPAETDSMDPFGITSEVSLVQSPSFG